MVGDLFSGSHIADISAQRWSRSEKWSDLGGKVIDAVNNVLNAGRDLRNGRIYERIRTRRYVLCSTLVAI